jgi:AcrR family transcriptional regulator
MTETAAPRRSDSTRANILAAARERFASDGYERATIRAIASDAGIDPAMVIRYFGNKEKLFAAAAEFDLKVPDLAAIPRSRLGAALVEHFLRRWELDDALVALLRAAMTNPAATNRMQQIFAASSRHRSRPSARTRHRRLPGPPSSRPNCSASDCAGTCCACPQPCRCRRTR